MVVVCGHHSGYLRSLGTAVKSVKQEVKYHLTYLELRRTMDRMSIGIAKDEIENRVRNVIDDQVLDIVYSELRWKIVPTP